MRPGLKNTIVKMRLVFNHEFGKYDLGNNIPLIYVECIPESETPQELFETGWLPWWEKWQQTRSARLSIGPISARRRRELSGLRIREGLSPAEDREWIDRLGLHEWVDPYYSFGGRNYTFTFDDEFWALAKIYDDQLMFCTMPISRSDKSYGTLSYYYLLQRFNGEFQYLYISDYYEKFKYKADLPGFQYWNGTNWVSNRISFK